MPSDLLKSRATMGAGFYILTNSLFYSRKIQIALINNS